MTIAKPSGPVSGSNGPVPYFRILSVSIQPVSRVGSGQLTQLLPVQHRHPVPIVSFNCATEPDTGFQVTHKSSKLTILRNRF